MRLRHLPSLTEQLAQLVATPSVSATSAAHDLGNGAVIELLADWLDRLGFAIEVTEAGRGPGGAAKRNLIATLGSGPGGLVLAGHTDTVPCDPELWRSDPFRLTEREGRLHGLGSCDMKGFFPLAIEAARQFAGQKLNAPLIILATADEESSMCGARQLVALGRPRGRHAVIGEPTGLRPVRLHKGITMESVRVVGQAGHSSDPALGRNAIEGMQQVITLLLELRDELGAQFHNSAFAVPTPTLNLGCIHGGDNPNRICGDCELQFDLRLLPGMQIDALRQMIGERLDRLSRQLGMPIDFQPLFPGLPAFETAADAGLVRLLERLTGHASEAVAFGTEAPFLTELGLETVVFGPGEIDCAHKPDEFLALDAIRPCVDLLTDLIGQLCLAPATTR
ncbi:MAG TPA: acetylornithine deacetylase [Pseudomonadales bacterium]|nr:acetylornithine deacetylase [Pseudomonadales bacterium]